MLQKFCNFGGTFSKHSQKTLAWVKEYRRQIRRPKIDEGHEVEKIKRRKELNEE